MDPIFGALANLGGVGILAVALLILHRDALQRFSEEARADRISTQEQWKMYLDLKLRHHEEVLEKIAAIECRWRENHQ